MPDDLGAQQLINDLRALNQVAEQTDLTLRKFKADAGQSITQTRIADPLANAGIASRPSSEFMALHSKLQAQAAADKASGNRFFVPPTVNPSEATTNLGNQRIQQVLNKTAETTSSINSVGGALARGDYGGAAVAAAPLLRANKGLFEAAGKGASIVGIGFVGVARGAEASELISKGEFGGAAVQIFSAIATGAAIGAVSLGPAGAAIGAGIAAAGAAGAIVVDRITNPDREKIRQGELTKSAAKFLADKYSQSPDSTTIAGYLKLVKRRADIQGLSEEERIKKDSEIEEDRQKAISSGIQAALIGNIPDDVPARSAIRAIPNNTWTSSRFMQFYWGSPAYVYVRERQESVQYSQYYRRAEIARIENIRFVNLTAPRKPPRTFY